MSCTVKEVGWYCRIYCNPWPTIFGLFSVIIECANKDIFYCRVWYALSCTLLFPVFNLPVVAVNSLYELLFAILIEKSIIDGTLTAASVFYGLKSTEIE